MFENVKITLRADVNIFFIAPNELSRHFYRAPNRTCIFAYIKLQESGFTTPPCGKSAHLFEPQRRRILFMPLITHITKLI